VRPGRIVGLDGAGHPPTIAQLWRLRA
jgi:hypothetical protein